MRALIYDTALLGLTSTWYAEVIDRLSPQSRVLDVGIGTGGALCRNADRVRERDLTIVGVDIDADYIARCRDNLEQAGLADRVEARLESVLDHDGDAYDAIYFSASFMLMPDPAAVLRHVTACLKPDGRIFFTQTFQDRPSRLMEWAKPLLRKVTTIDFGHVTYEADFRTMVADGGLDLVELTTLGQSGPRSYRLAVGVPLQIEA